MISPLGHLLEAWQRLASAPIVRLVILDIDGCLTPGEASPLDFSVLEQLQRYNQRSVADLCVPGLTVCSGRPEPYVEFMVQAIGGFLPAVWENGAGLYRPVEYRFELHPQLDSNRLEAFEEARRLVMSTLVRPGLARPQPGKEVSISLYPTASYTTDQLYRVASRALAPLAGRYWVQPGLTCIEVLPEGIHKGSGVRWLLDELGLGPSQALGVGDAPGDLEIFHASGLSATPANGHPDVRAAADYVAASEASAGVLEIIEWCIARNRGRG